MTWLFHPGKRKQSSNISWLASWFTQRIRFCWDVPRFQPMKHSPFSKTSLPWVRFCLGVKKTSESLLLGQICTQSAPRVATVGAPKQWCLKRWGTTVLWRLLLVNREQRKVEASMTATATPKDTLSLEPTAKAPENCWLEISGPGLILEAVLVSGRVIVRRFLVDNHHTVTTYNKPKCQPVFHKGSWEISLDLRKIPTGMPLRNQSSSISTLS